MHIAEGILSAPILLGSTAIAIGGVAIGLQQLRHEHVPLAAMLAAIFFVASLIHLPIGVSSVHLILNGLCGLLLGWIAFPVILVALFLQTLFFGYGGLTTLGINTLIMAFPAVACYYLFGFNLGDSSRRYIFWRGCLAGAFAIILGVSLIAVSLYLTHNDHFINLIVVILLAYMPVIAVETIVTGLIVSFLHQVQPDLLKLTNYLTC